MIYWVPNTMIRATPRTNLPDDPNAALETVRETLKAYRERTPAEARSLLIEVATEMLRVANL